MSAGAHSRTRLRLRLPTGGLPLRRDSGDHCGDPPARAHGGHFTSTDRGRRQRRQPTHGACRSSVSLPVKARLVVEQGKASVLVMRVVVTQGDGVELANGEALERLVGVLRIREHRRLPGPRRGPRVRHAGLRQRRQGGGGSGEPAKFQINISMAQDKFDTLFRLALAGRLPARFFVDAGVRTVGRGTRGLTHVTRRGRRIKQWDTTAFRILPVTNFVAILPVAVAMAEPPAAWPRAGVSAAAGLDAAGVAGDQRAARRTRRRTAGLPWRDPGDAERDHRRAGGHRAHRPGHQPVPDLRLKRLPDVAGPLNPSKKKHRFGKAWMQEHVNDHWVKEAQRRGYRSRAAFKLLELAERDQLLRPGMTVVDLGAAPGSWAQVLRERVGERGTIVAIDLLEMTPVAGVQVRAGRFPRGRGAGGARRGAGRPQGGPCAVGHGPQPVGCRVGGSGPVRSTWASWRSNLPCSGCNPAAIWWSRCSRARVSRSSSGRCRGISTRCTCASPRRRATAAARSSWSASASGPGRSRARARMPRAPASTPEGCPERTATG